MYGHNFVDLTSREREFNRIMEQVGLVGVMTKIEEQKRQAPEWQKRSLIRLPLDGTFANILENVRGTNERLSERLRHNDSIAGKREKRQYEKGVNGDIIKLGWEYFRQAVDKGIPLSEELREQAARVESLQGLVQPARYLAQFAFEQVSPSKTYYEEQVRKAFRLTGTERSTSYGTGELPAVPRYFLYGFGLAALEAGQVDVALLAFNDGEWLNDPFEGAGFQDSIIDKVQILDPASQVKAAETWEQIKADRVQPLQTSAPPKA